MVKYRILCFQNVINLEIYVILNLLAEFKFFTKNIEKKHVKTLFFIHLKICLQKIISNHTNVLMIKH